MQKERREPGKELGFHQAEVESLQGFNQVGLPFTQIRDKREILLVAT